MKFDEAVTAAYEGKRIYRNLWTKHEIYPDFVVMIRGREVQIDREPLVSILGPKTMRVEDHWDEFRFDPKGGVLHCAVGYKFTQDDTEADDWQVLDG